MKLACFLFLAILGSNTFADSDRIYLIGKRQVSNSTHTHAVMFYAKEITELSDCQQDIQRGYQGQWRYYHHRFPRLRGAAERLNYYCVKSGVRFNQWNKNTPYDHMYQFDLRGDTLKIKKMKHYASCLRDLRHYVRDETPAFFCAKVSQKVRM